MFDHPKIDTLDLRKAPVRLAHVFSYLRSVFNKSQEWIEWDEITWPWGKS
jgi:hypothetical protein